MWSKIIIAILVLIVLCQFVVIRSESRLFERWRRTMQIDTKRRNASKGMNAAPHL